jgi:hypothetical protein
MYVSYAYFLLEATGYCSCDANRVPRDHAKDGRTLLYLTTVGLYYCVKREVSAR